MKSSSYQNSKAASGRKSSLPSRSQYETEAVNVAVKQRVKRRRRRISNPKSTQTVDPDVSTSNGSKESNLHTNNVPRPMLHGNFAISGGHFVQAENVINNVNDTRNKAFELLQRHVAPAAFHNSAQRIDPPRCHPDTRVDIMYRIYDWTTQSEDRQHWLLWLNGAAGAGKSAIMQSLAERCVQAVIAIASFFFLRGDSTRNNIAPLVATLAYQLIQAIPETLASVLLTIEHNPLIFEQSLESQLQQLIIQPLFSLPRHLQRLFVVFVDGLDECNDQLGQSNLIHVFGKLSCSRNIPVAFLVASRREPQIEAAFRQKPAVDILHTLPLDETSASDDIRHFLNSKFNDIKATHLCRQYLPPDWPPVSVVEEIVAKASSQFIFASVIINYISSPRSNPATQLEIISGIRARDPSSGNPFAQLDALYQHIFSQVEKLSKVFDIIAYLHLQDDHRINHIQRAFLLENGELDVLFVDLTAIILCEPHTKIHPKLKFLHASLPDFLLDRSRSEKYHLDLDTYRTKLLCLFLERHPPMLDPLWSANDLKHTISRERSRLWAIRNLLVKAKAYASERLRSALMKFNFIFYNDTFLAYSGTLIGPDTLHCLKQLDFDDQGEAYSRVLDIFAAEYAKYWPLLKNSKKGIEEQSPDLIIRIDQIRTQVI